MTDQQILEQLRGGSRANEQRALRKLYAHKGIVVKLVRENSGSRADAADIFQEALLVFWRNVRKEDFKLTCAIPTYIYSVARNLWLKELGRRGKMPTGELSGDDQEDYGTEDAVEKEGLIVQAESVIAQLGERCRELLQLFYFGRMSMSDIAVKMNFRSDKVAKVQKYKCLERARKKLSETAKHQTEEFQSDIPTVERGTEIVNPSNRKSQNPNGHA